MNDCYIELWHVQVGQQNEIVVSRRFSGFGSQPKLGRTQTAVRIAGSDYEDSKKEGLEGMMYF